MERVPTAPDDDHPLNSRRGNCSEATFTTDKHLGFGHVSLRDDNLGLIFRRAPGVEGI